MNQAWGGTPLNPQTIPPLSAPILAPITHNSCKTNPSE